MPFFDHMLAQLGKHGGFDLTVRTSGDLEVDAHHTVEDTAIAVGQALREALGDKAGIRRFGDALVPLDETLVQAAVDLSGRPYVVHTEPEVVELIGTYDTTLTRHIWESFTASRAGLPARAGARRAQRPPRRRGAVQGGRPGAARRRGPRRPGHRRPVHQGLAVAVSVQRDRDRASGFLLTVDGTAAVARRPGRPDVPRVRVRPAAAATSSTWPPSRPTPLVVVHLGAGALTLARYVAVTRPGSRQRAVEVSDEVAATVRDQLPLARGVKVPVQVGGRA